MRSAYTPPSLDPTCGTRLGLFFFYSIIEFSLNFSGIMWLVFSSFSLQEITPFSNDIFALINFKYCSAPCVSYLLRKRALYGDMTRYDIYLSSISGGASFGIMKFSVPQVYMLCRLHALQWSVWRKSLSWVLFSNWGEHKVSYFVFLFDC